MDPEDLEDDYEESEEGEGGDGDGGSVSSNEFDVDGKTDMLNLPEIRDPDEDNPASFFYVNRFLPKTERCFIDEEGRLAVTHMLSVIDDLEHEFHNCDLLQEKTLLSFTHKLNSHMDLKYSLSTELRKRIIHLFLDIHACKEKTSIIGRTLALRILTILVGKQWGNIKLTIDWRPFWNELITRMYSEVYQEKFMTSDTILSGYYRSLALFLYSARRFYETYDENAAFCNNVVALAMRKLTNLRTPEFMEGVLLLAHCLSNEFAFYDQLLPKWFELWGKINQNTLWDMSWIQVMSHAIKNTPASFDWKPFLPFLYSKLKNLLRLPLVKATLTFNTFPRVVPSFYQFPFSFYSDFHHMMLLKLTKVITKIILKDTENTVSGENFKSCVTLPNCVEDMLNKRNLKITGFNAVDHKISESAAQLLTFVHTLRPFVHESAAGEHSARVAVFFTVILKTFGTFLGQALGEILLSRDETTAAAVFPSPATHNVHSIYFICGYLLTFVLDTVYVGDPRVNHAFARCLEHLVPIVPDSVHVFCAMFLDALEPRAFQNSNHGMIALKSLGFLIRPGLYPQPLIVPYITPLLKLTLLGLEASDPDRINAILYLMYQLFSWLPISTDLKLKVPAFKSYVQLLFAQSSEELTDLLKANGTVNEYLQEYESMVSFILQEWFPQLLERIFVITDAEEAAVKGEESTAISIAGQLLTIFYQALERNNETVVHEIASKLCDYILNRAPVHTDKTCGKLVEYFVSCFPQYVNYFLDGLLTSDFIAGSLTADRISFRLRLIGAVFRRSAGEAISEINETKFNAAFQQHYSRFLLHSDPKVRKFLGKVYKDVLKSLVSVYPIHQKTRYCYDDTQDAGHTGQKKVYLGQPNIALREEDMQWFVPTETTMLRAVHLLRDCSERVMRDMLTALDTNTIANSKVEECVGAGLSLLRRVARGVASLLSYNITSKSDYKEKVFIRTGRETYIALLMNQSDIDYINNYQTHVLTFLVDLHEKLELKTNLSNNVFVRKQWMKCVHVLITQRLSVCTDCETYRADLVSTSAMATSALSIATYKRLKLHDNSGSINADGDKYSLNTLIRSSHYWKRHDWNVHSLSEQVWTQHGIRALFFALQESHVAFSESENVARKALDLLLTLTRHNYDEIHPQARGYFMAMYDHFPLALRREYCQQLLQVLYQPHPGFYPMASTLVLLTSRFIELIHTDDELKSTFLLSISYVHSAAADETDEEKKEVILAAYSTLFIAYANGWSFPLHTLGKARVQDLLLQPCLESFGGKLLENEYEAVSGDLVEARNTGWKSRGMRYDTFEGFILTHLFEPQLLLRGHLSTVIVRFMWYHLTQCDDQPTQYIGDVLLFMITNVLQSSDRDTREQLLAQPWAMYLRNQLNPLNKQNVWRKFFKSQIRLALHTFVPDNSNIWSEDVDAVVDTLISPFLNLASGRESRRRTGMPQFSLNFSDSFATVVFVLCEVGVIPLLVANISPSEILRTLLFDILQDEVLHLNQHPQEKRLLNDLKAELFAGLLKFFFIHHEEFGDNAGNTDAVFAEYLAKQVDAVNVEYLQDWQESLYFATESLCSATHHVFAQNSEVCKNILREFASTVMMAGANLRSQLFLLQEHVDEMIADSQEEIHVHHTSSADENREDIPHLLRKYHDMDMSQASVKHVASHEQETGVTDHMHSEEDDLSDGQSSVDYDQSFPIALSRQASTAHPAVNMLPPPPSALPLTRQTSLDSANALFAIPHTRIQQPSAVPNITMLGLKRQRSGNVHNSDLTAAVVAAVSQSQETNTDNAKEKDVTVEEDEEDIWEDTPDTPTNQQQQASAVHQTSRNNKQAQDNKLNSAIAGGSQQDGGFAFIDKAFGLMRAVLSGLGTSALYLSETQDTPGVLWTYADEVFEFLAGPDVDLVMAYTSSRATLMTIIASFLDYSLTDTVSLNKRQVLFEKVLEKLFRAASDEDVCTMDIPPEVFTSISMNVDEEDDNEEEHNDINARKTKTAKSHTAMKPKQKRASEYEESKTQNDVEVHPHKKLKKVADKKDSHSHSKHATHSSSAVSKKISEESIKSREETRQTRRQYAVETLSFLLNWLWHMCNAEEIVRPVALRCVPVLLEAVATEKNETVQEAVAALFNFAMGILQCDSALRPNEAFEQTLAVVSPYLTKQPLWHDNWRVREVLLRCGMVLCASHWYLLSNSQKQIIKDIFVQALKDPVKQVQDTALLAMPDYLSLKTDSELKVIADAYLRNSDTLLAREKQKRRIKKQEELSSPCKEKESGSATTLDVAHLTTVQMLAALVLSRPYDLPSFAPTVLTSLLRHSSTGNDMLKSILQRTVQEFRTSHQDRWEQDLKHKFTAEQLEDLQGAGAAHYFA